MPIYTEGTLFKSEEYFMKKVYHELDRVRAEALEKYKRRGAEVQIGAFEDQAAFMAHGALAEARADRYEKETLIQRLYKKPYFSHIEAEGEHDRSIHYFLSDCEFLDKTIILEDEDALLPFKKDPGKPISGALFHCYQTKKGEPVPYSVAGKENLLVPRLICDDEIDNRKLIEAIQFYPEIELRRISADELLEEKLKENRSDPSLRNIIATLQRNQFEVIETDIADSFVVQGCAGSGKTQCLLHRLFYLRDILSEDGWDHVLLLTPTQLFRNYSENLIRRYQLSSVMNCSVADLYKSLLNAYDSRFKNRQYRFELTEEYLPDKYLQEVYESSLIRRIDDAINNAINKYVQDGCEALGINMPDHITSEEVKKIVRQLDRAIKRFDETESELRQNEQYAQKREEYDRLQKEVDKLKKRRDRALKDYDKIVENSQKLNDLAFSVQEAENERKDWEKQLKSKRDSVVKSLYEVKMRWDSDEDISLSAEFAEKLYLARDVFYGEVYKADTEYTQFLDEYCLQLKGELQELTKNQSISDAYEKYEKRKKEIMQRADQLANVMAELTGQIEEYSEWLQKHANIVKGEESNRVLQRSEMERARYYLSRLESTIFEKDVWAALAPLKEKHGVNSFYIENTDDGHKRETRILYKSDVLFYLKIYTALYPNEDLPDYHLICIDEGQDLHQADYDMLHRLYPDATFNIFGDTNQVLHTACGIDDWKKETGINQVYVMDQNYRNTAPVVDFCNRTFGSSMRYVGTIGSDDRLEIIDDALKIKTMIVDPSMVLIVKDKSALERFCMKIGKPSSDFEYLDTTSEQIKTNRIPCYSVYAAKGLEFTKAVVYAEGMTLNQKLVASTRAMEELYYYE